MLSQVDPSFRQFSRRTIVRREFARTRANSPGFAANSREFANCSPTFFSCEHWRTIGEHSANSREHWRSSREFARIRAEFAANWRTVRQKSVFIESFSSGFKYSANYSPVRGELRANSASVRESSPSVRQSFTSVREKKSWRTVGEFAANDRSPAKMPNR